MDSRELAVAGAFEFVPQIFHDDRGLVVTPFQHEDFARETGREFFTVAQTIHSWSRRGTVRGVHFTTTPPGMAKYVYCLRGQVIDIVVDLRRGSPTFRKWDAVRLDGERFHAVCLPVGVGHAFIALRDDTVVAYMLSESYAGHTEMALSIFDPEPSLPIPDDLELTLSPRDRAAPTLAELMASDSLPCYSRCQEIEKSIMPLTS